MKKSKRILSIFMCILMIASALPAYAFAADTSNPYTLNSAGQRQYFLGNAMNIAPEIDGAIDAGEYSLVKKYDITGKTNWDNVSTDTERYYVSGNVLTTGVGIYMSYDAEYLYLAATSTVADGAERNNNETVEFDLCMTDDTNNSVVIILKKDGSVQAVQKRYAAEEITKVADTFQTESISTYKEFVVSNAAAHNEDTKTLTYELKLSRAGLQNYYGETTLADKFICRTQISTIASSGVGTFFWMASNNSGTGLVEGYKTYGGRLGHAVFMGQDEDFSGTLGSAYSYCTEHTWGHYVVYSAAGCKQICACGEMSEVKEHAYGEATITRPAGATTDGEQTKVCQNCSYKMTEVIPAVGATNTEQFGYIAYTMMGNNILQTELTGDGIDDGARFTQLIDAYRTYNPDIISFQECDEGWHDLLDADNGIATLGYAAATEGFVSTDLSLIRNPIYYKTDVFEVVDAGLQVYSDFTHITGGNPWAFSWAVLAAKETNERFLVSSTHAIYKIDGVDRSDLRLKFAQEQIAKLQEVSQEYHVPVVMMGDYNEVESGDSYKALAAQYVSAEKGAEVALNMEYATHNALGSVPPTSNEEFRRIDHCFYSSGIDAIKYETVLEGEPYKFSDHVPQRLYFRLDNGTQYDLTDDFTSATENETITKTLNTTEVPENFRISLDVMGGSKTGMMLKNSASGAEIEVVFDNNQVSISGAVLPKTAKVNGLAGWNPNGASAYVYTPCDGFTITDGNVYTLNMELYKGDLTLWVDGYRGSLSLQTSKDFSATSIGLLCLAGKEDALKCFRMETLDVIVVPYAAADFATYRTPSTDADGNVYYKDTPTYKGYSFAGWFTNKACTSGVGIDVTKIEDGTCVYAKYVSPYVLTAKAQISSRLHDTYWSNDDSGSIRFVTTIDSKKYSKAGFILSYTLDGEAKETMVGSNKVYSTLYAEAGDANSGTLAYKPNEEFSKSSTYFKSWTFTDVEAQYYGVDFLATPYWITLDGTLVRGSSATRSVERGINVGFMNKKTALVLGDSAALGQSDTPANDFHGLAWGGRLADKYGLIVENFAQENATLSDVQAQVANVTKIDYTYVVLQGATSSDVQIDATSLIQVTQAKFADAVVVYVIEPSCKDAAATALIAACDACGIRYIDLRNSGATTDSDLTAADYDLITPIIAKKMSDVKCHTRCLCGLDENGEHFGACDRKEILWEAWEKDTSLPTANGNYYLTKDVTTPNGTQTQISANHTVNLDLNGHIVTNHNNRIYTFASVHNVTGVSFNVNDCSHTKTGALKTAVSDQGTIFWMNSSDNTISIYGGTLDASAASYSNGTLGAVNVASGTFKLYGGSLVGNSNPSTYGLALSVNSGASFHMTGGTISGGKSSTSGNIYLAGTMTMSGGTITGGTATESGSEGNGNLAMAGSTPNFTMTGGYIEGNVSQNVNGTVTLGGTAIIGENADTHKGLTILAGNKVAISSDTPFQEGASVAVNGVGDIAIDVMSDCTAYIYLDESAGFGEIEYDETSKKLTRTDTVTKCICGLDEDGEHYGDCSGEELTWQAWTDSTSLPTSGGNYSLTTDVTRSGQTGITSSNETLNLDLNGHTITATSRLYHTFNIHNATLNLTDLSADRNGALVSSASGTNAQNGAVIYMSDTEGCKVNMYAGTLDGSQAEASIGSEPCTLQIYGGTFKLFGGCIKGNQSSSKGLAVGVHSGATFTMKGGSILDGKSDSAGNVRVYEKGTMNMYGGSIYDGYHTNDYLANIFVQGNFNIYGGTIQGKTVYNADDLSGVGLFSQNNATITYNAP